MNTASKKSLLATDQPIMRRIGAQVRERLAADPQVWQVPSDDAEVFAVGDFLSLDECARLVAMIDAVARPSTVFDLSYSDGFRTSYSGDVDPHDPFIKKINRRIDDLMGIDPSHGETIQGQRYMPGQEFKPHHDWFYPGTSYWEKETSNGGQRCFTTMAFLNEVEGGGTTDFPELGISIAPKPGVLLLWNNADRDGMPNKKTLHAGCPVTSGCKYIFTKWYRARAWNHASKPAR